MKALRFNFGGLFLCKIIIMCYNIFGWIMIIDTHVHFGSAAGFNLSQKDVLTAMENYKIDKAIVSNIAAVEFDQNQRLLPEKFQTSLLTSAKDTIDFAKDNPGKIFAAIWIKPHLEQPDAELEYLLKIHPQYVKALKVHPFYSNTAFDGPEVEAYIQLAERLELPVITHTAGDDNSSCIRVYNAAKKYPSVRFVMAHLGLESNHQEAIELCTKLPNLYADTAWVSMEALIRFVKIAGSEKIMFGSDMPIDGVDTYAKNRWGQKSIYQDYFNVLESKIPATAYENIMWKNAEAFYKL